jgi:TonB family protein
MPVLSTPGTPYTPGRTNFGLLPEPERSHASFFTSLVINGLIVSIAIYLGSQVKKLVQHKYEETVLILPTTPPPPPKVKLPEPPKITPPEPPKVEVKLETPKINMPKPEPKPEPKPVEMEAKVNLPVAKAAKPAVVLAPQPKAALTAAMPAQNNLAKASTAPVHLGETFGVTPNPNATRPATVAAIGNPYGGMQGPAVAPHGVVGSTGIGDGVKSGSNAGMVGKVASAGLPGGTGTASTGVTGKVASAGVPTAIASSAPVKQSTAAPAMTSIEVLSKPPVQYTSEARQLRIEGDVVLRVTFTAAGQVVVEGVTRGLGHGLDEEARRVAQQIRFRPATRNGQAVDSTTTIRITFQLA